MIEAGRNRIGRGIALAGLSLGLMILLGCGGKSGPTRYDLSGAATFQGKPIPYGTISFRPDTSRGNSGPGGFVQIREGQYETESGKGTVGGPHVLTISGFAQLPGATPGAEGAPQLFSPYEMKIDLPKEDTTRDIEVPVSPRR